MATNTGNVPPQQPAQQAAPIYFPVSGRGE